MSEIFSRILTRFCRKIVGLASDRLRLHRRRSETISASVFSFNLFPPGYMWGKGWFSDLGHLYFSLYKILCHSLLQQERLKLLAIRSEAPLYTRRFTTISPYESSETITVSVPIVAGRLRFSRRAPETTHRHWISTWISNPTQNLATSLRLFGGRLLCLGCPKWVKNLASNLQILSSKLGTATGVAMPKKSATSRRRPESASDGCKIVRSVSRFC